MYGRMRNKGRTDTSGAGFIFFVAGLRVVAVCRRFSRHLPWAPNNALNHIRPPDCPCLHSAGHRCLPSCASRLLPLPKERNPLSTLWGPVPASTGPCGLAPHYSSCCIYPGPMPTPFARREGSRTTPSTPLASPGLSRLPRFTPVAFPGGFKPCLPYTNIPTPPPSRLLAHPFGASPGRAYATPPLHQHTHTAPKPIWCISRRVMLLSSPPAQLRKPHLCTSQSLPPRASHV